MRKTQTHTRRVLASKNLFAVLILLAGLAVIGYSWYVKQHRHTPPKDGTTATTTSSAPSAQANFKGDGQKEIPTTTPATDIHASDQSGSSTNNSTPPRSQWSTSKDGASIIVYGPPANSKFTSGELVYGKATSSTVLYRLIDNVSGVITSGTANVISGNFSIKFSFSSKATQGDIELYNQTSPYGPESNNVLIPVRF